MQIGAGVGGRPRVRGQAALLAVLWGLCLLSLLTSAPNRPFTLLEPLTGGWWVLVGAFVLTTTALSRPLRGALSAHLAVVGLLLALRPLSSCFGRDGTTLLIALYGLYLLWSRTRARPELKLLAGGSLAGVLLLEAGLSLADARAATPRLGLLDFGDLLGPCGFGGCLRAGLDVAIVAEKGEGRFVTTHHGFRNRASVRRRKPPGWRRVLLLGDSFVAGYRMDQEDTVGRRLELLLREATGEPRSEVLIAELPHPQATCTYLQQHAWRLAPDLVVVGLTIGNDLAQAWSVRRQVPEPLVAASLLPPDAFRRGPLDTLTLRLDRSLRSWRGYRRLVSLLREDAITSDYPDSPGSVHVFDAMHGLGHFYARRRLGLVEESWQETERLLRELRRAGGETGAPTILAVFPQRFQTRAAAWDATAFEYGLDPAAFDLELPNRRLAVACAAAGLECVDLLPAFRAEARASYLPLGDMHWNARGHDLAARALLSAAGARLGAAP